MKEMKLMQGNTYSLPIKLKMCGSHITDKDVSRIEFTFGRVVKHYPEGVVYEDGRFIVSLTQEDTFALAGKVKYQARVLFEDSAVKSSRVCEGDVFVSISKAVLK